MADTGAAGVRFAFDSHPVAGEVVEVAAGILWLRMPLPFELDHINLWLLADGDSWTVVDTGLANETSRAVWERVFREHLAGRPIKRVIVTHFHPDHVGLAGWLVERCGADLWMPREEWLYGRLRAAEDRDGVTPAQLDLLRRAGCDDSFLEGARQRSGVFRELVAPLPDRFCRIRSDDRILVGQHDWHVITARGHSPEHACLYSSQLGILIGGDQVLPRISPNISVLAWEPDADPLGEFLTSLNELGALPGDTLVLPSHIAPFYGFADRLESLRSHHLARCEELLVALDQPRTAFNLMAVLFRRQLTPKQMGFALGETLAHLNYLLRCGRITRSSDSAGCYLYAASAK